MLMSAPSLFGRIGSDGSVDWQDRGTLLLTPTTLYFLSGMSRSFSFVAITGATAGVMPVDRGFAGKRPESLLIVNSSATNCWAGCAFDLAGDGAEIARAVAIIAAQRPRLDPFGRIDGPGPVWLAAGAHCYGHAFWTETPEYLRARAPESKKMLDARLREHSDRSGRRRSATVFGDALRSELVGESSSGYEFRPAPGDTAGRCMPSGRGTSTRAYLAADRAVKRLLVSDLETITLREQISALGQLSVVVTVKVSVGYFDLDPPRDGRRFYHELRFVRPIEAWLELDDAGFMALLQAAARQAAGRVRQDLRRLEGSNERR
ncbi:MAG: hypothetical protein R3E86_15865 [Pseudomonadales bacterium]